MITSKRRPPRARSSAWGAGLALYAWLSFGCLGPKGPFLFAEGREGWAAIRGPETKETIGWGVEPDGHGGRVISTAPWWVDRNHGPPGRDSTAGLHLVGFIAAEQVLPVPWLRLRACLLKTLDKHVRPWQRRLIYCMPAPRLDFRKAVVRGSVRGCRVDLESASLVFWFQTYDRRTDRYVN